MAFSHKLKHHFFSITTALFSHGVYLIHNSENTEKGEEGKKHIKINKSFIKLSAVLLFGNICENNEKLNAVGRVEKIYAVPSFLQGSGKKVK
jgi:hypothetical protein